MPGPIMSAEVCDLLGLPPSDAAPIAADDPATVAALRRRLWAAGYRPLAVRTRDKAPAGLVWQGRARRDPPEAAVAPADVGTLNTGILCDGLRVLDIDVDDHAIADRIEALAFASLGAAPVRWRENSGRCALFYRAAEGEPGKRVLSGSAGKVEVLGHGQHVLAFGLHPSGAPLRWRPAPLDAVPLADLPAVTEEALTAFLAAVASMIGADAAGAGSGSRATGGSRADIDQTSLRAPSAEMLAEAAPHVANRGGYDDWIAGLCAFKAAATGLLDDDGRELAREWTDRWSGEGRGGGPHIDFDGKWEQQRPPFAAGWAQVERAARKNGFMGGVVHEFGGLDLAALVEGLADKGDPSAPLPAHAANRIDALDNMNRFHVCVAIGGKTLIARDTRTPNGHQGWTFSKPADLRLFYKPRPMPGPKGGCRVDAWMAWEHRTTARGVTFAPGEPMIAGSGYLNEWRGFAIQPDPGATCARFHEHVRDIVCRGDPANFRYVWGWLAHLVQRPAEKPGVALVLRGRKGAGKTAIGRYLAPMLGQHATLVDDREHLLGRFNAHLGTALLVQVEEAVWAGDKAAEGKLKSLITAETQMLERKGIDAVQVPSFCRLLFSSNEDWVVPATFDERRYVVLDVSPSKIGDKAYFAALFTEADRGGAAALMHALQQEDISGFDVRAAPRTDALMDQIERSLPPAVSWWQDCLARGYVTDTQRVFGKGMMGEVVAAPDGEWADVVRRDLFDASFADYWTGRRLGSHRPDLRVVARALADWLPEGKLDDGPRSEFPPPVGDQRAGTAGRQRQRTYRLPPLDECRGAFGRKLGRVIDWGAE